MHPAIRVDKLSKFYRLSEKEKRGGRTLGETLSAMAVAPFRKAGRRLGLAHGDATRGVASDVHWALRDVSFEVQPGEVAAVFGPNGAGKSTLFKILSRITRPSSGTAWYYGRLGSLLELGTGFHPELTGRENVFLNGAFLGMPRSEIARKFDEIVAFAEIDEFIDMPVKRYSSGMHVRLAFAVAAHLEPDILLLDEVMSVGDSEFHKKSQQRIEHLTRQGITTLIISHSPTDVMVVAKRGFYIRQGRLVFDGDLRKGIAQYAADTKQDLETARRRTAAGAGPAATNQPVAINSAAAPAPAAAPPPRPPAKVPASPPPRAEAPNPIVAVTAGNARGETALAEGDDLHVTVRYRPVAAAKQVHFQISLWNRQDVMLTCADTRFGNQPRSPGGTEGEAVCVFPAVPLSPGRYAVRVAMTDPDTPGLARWTYGWGGDQLVCNFVVADPAGTAKAPTPPSSGPVDGGIIRLPFEWVSAAKGPARSPRDLPWTGRLERGFPALGRASGSPTSGYEPVVLSVDADRPMSLWFDYPDDPELPMNIVVNSQAAPAKDRQARADQPERPAGPPARLSLPELPPGFRREMAVQEPNSVVGFLDYGVRITTGFEFYTQYKDIFVQRIYHFEPRRPDPVVVDAGGHFGMAALYFKHAHPRARVTVFEPDPALFRTLQENMKRNGLSDVTLINAGLGARSETTGYSADPITGALWPDEKGETLVQVRRLSEFLIEPVDYLKLSLDGQEWAVLQELEAAGKLGLVREMAVVYHDRPQAPPRLGAILEAMARAGFRYLVHDFDEQTNRASKPPFRLTPQTRWACLVFARRPGDDSTTHKADPSANGAA
jgi:FkbM family methyltransferase